MPKTERMEFGVKRTSCACEGCKLYCRFMPGCLIPADLERMIPAGADPFVWAEQNLLASPGAVVMRGENVFRIPTLVPATKREGGCIHLTADGRCDIHPIAPFGCSFFSCGPEPAGLASQGMVAVAKDHRDNGLYSRIWVHLFDRKLTQHAPEVLRSRMNGLRLNAARL